MSQEIIKFDKDVIELTVQRITASLNRMKELETLGTTTTIRPKVGSDSHTLCSKTHKSILTGMTAIEAEAKKKGVRAQSTVVNLVGALARTVNMLDSADDLYKENEMTRKELRNISTACRTHLRDARAIITASFTKTSATLTHEEAADKIIAQAGIVKNRDDAERREKFERIQDESTRNILKDTKLHTVKLPDGRVSDKSFVMLKLPVTAVFEKLITEKQLQEAGFHLSGSIGMNPIIQDQWFIGVNNAAVKEMHKVSSSKYAKEITGIVGQKLGTEFHIMGPHGVGHAKSFGFTYFWIMSDKDLNNLLRVVKRSGGSVIVDDYGLAIGK